MTLDFSLTINTNIPNIPPLSHKAHVKEMQQQNKNNEPGQNNLVLETLFDIKEQIGSLNSKFDTHAADFKQHSEDDKAFQKDIHVRLRALEDYKNKLTWFLSIAWTVALVAIEFVKSYIFPAHK